MHDQRVEMRAAFRLEYPRHGPVVACIPAKPVNRLSRKPHQPTTAQYRSRSFNPVWRCAKDLGVKGHCDAALTLKGWDAGLKFDLVPDILV